MAARLQLRHQDEIRAKIQTSQLCAFLERLALEGAIAPENSRGGKNLDWDSKRVGVRVKAAQILLDKTLGNVSSVEITGAAGGPIETKDASMVDVAKRLAFILTSGASQAQGAS